MGSKQSTNADDDVDTQEAEQPAASYTDIDARRQADIQRVQNLLLVWLDSNIDNNNNDCQNTITQLRQVVNEIKTFTEQEQCVRFIKAAKDRKVYTIVSGALGEHLVRRVHDMPQVDSIFIFCGNKKNHEGWSRNWTKIKGVFINVDDICKAMKQTWKQCEQDDMPISFMSTSGGAANKNLNQLDPSFMYTELLNKILLTIEFEPKHFNEYIKHCRCQFSEDENELRKIKKFKRNYKDKTPIGWYTDDSFLYRMLNSGLRTMDVGIVIKMGFFIKELHGQIQKLHSEQFGRHLNGKAFTVYRGQGLSMGSFKQMKSTQGGLLSFDYFLSTSKKRDAAMKFAHDALTKPNVVGILFVMNIDPAQSTTPFASVKDLSYYGDIEDEVLFSMQSVFRIGSIQSMDENARLFQVTLTLTSDNDPDLRQLTDHIEKETSPGEKGWYRLASVLRKMDRLKEAKEVFSVLLDQCDDESERGRLYLDIGMVKSDQGKYHEALECYEEALEIKKKTLPPNHLSLAAIYGNSGAALQKIGNYSKALSSYEKALTLQQQSLPPNHRDLATSYNNIGGVHRIMCDYPKALSFYEKALVIQQQSLPPTHPDIARSKNNIGLVHYDMGDYPKALSFYEEALASREQSLLPNHRDLATTHMNIANVYLKTKDYRRALSSHEEALRIRKQSLSPTHADLARSYYNIGMVYSNMGNDRKALSNYERAVEIGEQSSSKHPDLQQMKKSVNDLRKKT